MSTHQSRKIYPDWLDEPIDPKTGLQWLSPVTMRKTVVQGHDLTGAMVYLGKKIKPLDYRSEPSQIDPSLPISGEQRSTQFGYTSTYTNFTPDQRQAYLRWLARGRRDRDADYRFVRLYLDGLERRILIDGKANLLAQAERRLLLAEVMRIQTLYGKQMYGGNLESLIDILTIMLIGPDDPIPVPTLSSSMWAEPTILRFGLGRFVYQKKPIPADWAAAWAWYQDNVTIRSAMQRTPDEFRALFMHHYTKAFGEGLLLRTGKREVSIHYQAPNISVGAVQFDLLGIPDVYVRPTATEKLNAIVYQVWEELGPYARAVSRTFHDDHSLATVSLLPSMLLTRHRKEIRKALRWVETKLGKASRIHIPERDLVSLWWPQPGGVSQLTPKDRKTLIAMFGTFGYGAEPDLRYGRRPGAPTPGEGLTIFRAEIPVPAMPSPNWNAAVVASQFGAAMVAQGEPFDGLQATRLADEMAQAFQLGPTEALRNRLALEHLTRSEAPIKITGVKAFLDPLSIATCERIGTTVMTMAARSGTVSPATVTLVQKIARSLGLDPATVPSRLFAAMTPDDVSARLYQLGNPLPIAKPRELRLDHTAIAATEAATAAVADLLGDILREEDHPVPTAPPPTTSEATIPQVSGLDAAHSALLLALAAAADDDWSPEALDALAREHHLLGAGAIDTLNDAALDLLDEILIEESSNGFTIDRQVLVALLHPPTQ